jgi:hypothetical protein
MKAHDAQIDVALPLFAHRVVPDAHSLGHFFIRCPGSADQNDLGSLHQRVWKWSGFCDALELLYLLIAEDKRSNETTNRHGTTPGRRHS